MVFACVADVERGRELGGREKGRGIPFCAFLPLILPFLHLPHRLRWFLVLSKNNNNNNNNFILCTKIQKLRYFPPQIAGRLVVTGQDKYMNNTI